MKKIILGGLVATVVACVLLFVFVINPDVEAQANEFGALAAACSGTDVPAAAAYPANPANLISFDTQRSGFTLSNHAPLEWKAKTLSGTALVLCLGENKETLIETCDYEKGKKIKRYIHVQAVELRAAQTGEVVGTEDLKGEEPAICDNKEAFKTDVVERTGEKVTSDQLKSWLEAYVLP